MLKETINDKNNTKVIINLHQGHFKVEIAKKNLKISTFYQRAAVCNISLGKIFICRISEYVSDR